MYLVQGKKHDIIIENTFDVNCSLAKLKSLQVRVI